MNVRSMPMQARLEIVIRKACALLPGDAGRRLAALLSPTALAITAGVVAIWAASHFVGVGEIADVVLLVTGVITIGAAAIDGGRKLVDFALTTYQAQNEADLDRAARALADAVTILGIDVVLSLLLKAKPKGTFKQPYKPEYPMPSYEKFARVMPAAGPLRRYEARLVFTKKAYTGVGSTHNRTNTATVGRDFYPPAKSRADAVRDLRKAVYHERIHQRLTQAFALLGRPGLYLKLGAYKRSFILRYIEEACAEAYGLAKAGGARPGELTALQFPLNGQYGITVAQMRSELKGVVLGPVVVGEATFHAAYGPIHDN